MIASLDSLKIFKRYIDIFIKQLTLISFIFHFNNNKEYKWIYNLGLNILAFFKNLVQVRIATSIATLDI